MQLARGDVDRCRKRVRGEPACSGAQDGRPDRCGPRSDPREPANARISMAGSRLRAGTKLGTKPAATSNSPDRKPATSAPPSTWKRMTSRSRYARCLPQYRGLRRSVISLPRFQCSTRNGPLPIGSPVFGFSIPSLHTVARSSPRSACRGRILPNRPRNAPKRERSTTLTVFASIARTLRTYCALCGGVVGRSVLQERPVREHEVRGRDRYSVAPLGLGPDVIREHERPPPRVGDTRDEPRTPGKSGPTSNADSRTLSEDRPERERRRSRSAPLVVGIEAGGLVRRLGEHDGAAAFRRLCTGAAGSRDGEKRDDYRCC